ncbi:HWE histidine kinase domain-containing protein [Falsiroseomonas sp. HW251]|uniref:HWE histidine kinase domain-containing protein n=1 Tax=Falsiroseomonas sp. HW251 TaxID=3390998 RepID=UPI003D314C24
MAQNYREAFELRLSDTARALALALDAELGSAFAAVETLAASPLLDDSSAYEAFNAQASRVAARFGTYIVVSSPDPPRQILNTRFPPGAPLPAMVAPDTVREMLRSGRAAVSDLRFPPALAEPVVAAMAPVLRDGAEATLAVVLPFRPTRLSDLLQAQGLSGGAFATLVDSSGAVVARSAEQERFVGRRVPAWYEPQVRGRSGGQLEGAAIDGQPMIFSFQRLRTAPGWTVVVAEPVANFRMAWLPPLLGLLGGAAAALALGIGLSVLVARRILRPVSALANRAEATAAGGLSVPLAPLPPAGVTEFQVLQTAVDRAEVSLREASARLEAALRAARLGVFERHLPSDTARWDERATEMYGGLSPQDCAPGLEAWRARVHPADRAARDAAIAAVVLPGGRDIYEVEFRFRRDDGGWNWIAAHGAVTERDPLTGRAVRIAGVVQDVTERKAADDRQQLLMREVDHRAKNALAVVQAALRLTPKDDMPSYARAVEGRVNALARAHGLLAENRWSSADLRSLARGELEAFLLAGTARPGARGPAVELDGPDLRLRPEAAQAFSMVLHELATNATKHGALSVRDGRVRLAWRVDAEAGVVRLDWTERGGPPIAGPPVRRGFGTRVLERTVRDQLRGRVAVSWEVAGLVCRVELPLHFMLDGDAVPQDSTRGNGAAPDWAAMQGAGSGGGAITP